MATAPTPLCSGTLSAERRPCSFSRSRNATILRAIAPDTSSAGGRGRGFSSQSLTTTAAIFSIGQLR